MSKKHSVIIHSLTPFDDKFRVDEAALRKHLRRLAEAGVELDKKRIHLYTPVKTLGKHEVKIKLHSDVTVDLSFDVVSENPIVPVAEEAAPSDKKPERRERRERSEKK